jgi:WD40 repeat protein
LERLFAKPFIAQLGNGHVDGVYCIAKDWRKLPTVASGSGDGVVKTWDLVSRAETFSVRAHDGIVNGLCYTVDGRLLSCSTDKMIKLWEPGTKEVFHDHSRINSSLFKHILVAWVITQSTIIAKTIFSQQLRPQ